MTGAELKCIILIYEASAVVKLRYFEVKLMILTTDSIKDPIGIDDTSPEFAWITEDIKNGAVQKSYRIRVYKDSDIVWDSGEVFSDESCGISYGGEPLQPCTRYCWGVELTDSKGGVYSSENAYFETALMGADKSVWSGAQWICPDGYCVNPMSLECYSFECSFRIISGSCAGIVLSARNRDNYILFSVNRDDDTLTITEYSDNAWEDREPTEKILLRADILGLEMTGSNRIRIYVDGRNVSVMINGQSVISMAPVMPESHPFRPQKSRLMSVGFRQYGSAVFYSDIDIRDMRYDKTLCSLDSSCTGPLTSLGAVENGGIKVENSFEITSPQHAPVFVRLFKTGKGLRSARMYSTAHGFYTVSVNGVRAGSGCYAPGFTDYDMRIQYRTCDIADLLIDGENKLCAVVGHGYYSGFAGYNRNAEVYGSVPSFLCKIVLEYEDRQEMIVTDGSWRYSDMGPVIDSDYLQGETFDARLAGISAYKMCAVKMWQGSPLPVNGSAVLPPFRLEASPLSLAEIRGTVRGVFIREYPKGHYIYDFGENIVGAVRIRARGERGMSVKIRYGEMCSADGSVYLANLRSAANTDVYIFRGDETEVYMPEFSSHGFRYAEISGCGNSLEDIYIESVNGIIISGAGGKRGEFVCSNELINQLQKNIVRGAVGNLLLVPTDCPQRNERMGWTGDAQVFIATAAYNLDVCAFMRKWLKDVRDAQLRYNRGGAVPDTAPLCGDNRPMGGCGGWGDAAVIVPWELYMAYGQRSVLEENYELMRGWVDYISSDERMNRGIRYIDGQARIDRSDTASEPYIQVQQSRGDHLAADASTPFILSATAYAANSARIMSLAADVLGRNEDEVRYREIFEKIKAAFNEAWVKEDGTIAYWGEMSKPGICDTYYSETNEKGKRPSQTAYALAVDFGLIKVTERTVYCFNRTILDADGKLSVGFLGVSHIIPALEKAGLTETAYSLLTQEECPGWLYSVKNGATTIWERWDSYNAETGEFGDVSMNSFNHYAYGAVGEWFYRGILGIRPLVPGYKRILLKPVMGKALSFAAGSHMTPRGRVYANWRRYGDKFIYCCTVPGGVTAVFEPGGVCRPVSGSGDVCEYGEGFKLSGGEFEFEIRMPDKDSVV